MKLKLHMHRGHIAFAHDLVMAAFSFLAAVYLRLGEGWTGLDRSTLAVATVGFAAVSGAVFLSLRMYKGVWRYASVNDLVALVRAGTLAVVIFYVLMFLATRLEELPRSVVVINWFVLLGLLGGPRFAYRSFKEHRRLARRAANDDDRVPVLLVGVGDEAELFIRATMAPDAEYHAVGMVSAAGGRVGRNIHGIEVLGSIAELDQVVTQLKAKGQAPHRLIITASTVRWCAACSTTPTALA
jgi:FlaA1/EpsC-like NDP-sugar epimerase